MFIALYSKPREWGRGIAKLWSKMFYLLFTLYSSLLLSLVLWKDNYFPLRRNISKRIQRNDQNTNLNSLQVLNRIAATHTNNIMKAQLIKTKDDFQIIRREIKKAEENKAQ